MSDQEKRFRKSNDPESQRDDSAAEEERKKNEREYNQIFKDKFEKEYWDLWREGQKRVLTDEEKQEMKELKGIIDHIDDVLKNLR